VELAGGSDLAARCLSGFCPPPVIAGCSQAVFGGESDLPVLVRNYDYSPRLWEAVIVRSAWAERRVLGMSDCLIGLLDGINQDGLCVSLAFGGRRAVGEGFGMPVILRYVLETCPDVPRAVAALTRIPSYMAYNVTLLDAAGARATVLVGPDRPARVTEQRVITNHQGRIDWPRYAIATGSVDRLRVLNLHAADPDETEERFVRRFLEPPVFSNRHAEGMGTLYTAVYRPRTRRVSYLWPRQRWDAGIDDELDGHLDVSYELPVVVPAGPRS
jgi:predicted choloylglycine hydrolase